MLRTLLYMGGLLVVLFLGFSLYGKAAPRFFPPTVPDMAPPSQRADAVQVIKSERVMRLLREGEVIAEYRIALGASPEGHKQQEGDQRTPEGEYIIDWRNPRSIAHLSLHVSYPNEHDQAVAHELGVSPGGNIMIHGILNGWGWLGRLHRYWDWTDGCIAVTNREMREIWSLVPNGTPISINK
ncbi:MULTISPECIES: L,D-transpeptidase family protein [Halomonadaceae]|uniref:L,D-transpeptidase family protein n=1 Tax=Billgrantia aerodenitrificans TaxID=2733483 RepID=A0ABS9AV77_9GAMM|nr:MULTISPECIES: L,D-transpeptidase family protein [Halomonas]MCE8025634.1 L,D-transpeptidase family protein [Halomonas aerodenitrificans]MCE8038426.1 L,D-transpeptidase family protein [Halomonas sp. MCCC 1A11062]